MLVSLKWLKDYVDLDISPEDLSHRLTMAGLEVEDIREIAPQFTGVVVAKILSVKSHPAAEHLSVCEVTDGADTQQIVCGAKNVAAGDVVPLARIGAVIPGGYTIKSSVLRGETSEGMLCSEAELEIGDDQSGIMQLPKNLKLGLPLEKSLDLSDTVLDVNVTPNRSDCLSMVGIAREVAAITGGKMKRPTVKIKESSRAIQSLASVRICDPDLCPRYTARMIQDVHIAESPVWLKTRLAAVGLRSINNVVDITNFVMLETGQPLHAFDFRFLEEGRIIVRKSTENETFISLDGKERVLPENTIMICDGVKPVAIGGIMGGLNSEVTEKTETILLESAYFNPQSIRRSSRKLGLSTDAAFRFERGIDPEGVVAALHRASQLIAALAGGSVCKNWIDEYPKKIETANDIPLRLDRLCRLIGADIKPDEALRILRGIGMMIKRKGRGVYAVTPPTSRVDISREADLIEEVVRLYGYDRVPATMPNIRATENQAIARVDVEDKIRQVLVGCGYTEIINYSFILTASADALCLPEKDERRNFVQIKNPLGEDFSVMRTTMLYGLMDTVRKNSNNGSFDLKLFEIGRIFINRSNAQLPEEINMLAGIATGKISETFWNAETDVDFFYTKGSLENIFRHLKIREGLQYIASETESFLHPGKSCAVFLKDQKIGSIGAIHPNVMEKFDFKNNIYVFEINLDLLTNAGMDNKIVYREIPRFPAVTRDAAFLIPRNMEADKLLNIVCNHKEDLLENVSVFDVYTGTGVPDGTKSLGLRFSYRAPDRTLTDSETSAVHDKIVQKTVEISGAKIRS